MHSVYESMNYFFCLCMYNEKDIYHVPITKAFCNLIPVFIPVEPKKTFLPLRVNFII